MEIKTVRDFLAALKQGPYTSIGGYPIFFYTADDGVLSYKTAKSEYKQIASAIRNNDRHSGWRVVGADINYESHDLYDDHTGEQIEAAYGDDERRGNPTSKRRKSKRSKR